MGLKKHVSIKIGYILVILKENSSLCACLLLIYFLDDCPKGLNYGRTYLTVSVITILLLSGETGEDIKKVLNQVLFVLTAPSQISKTSTVESAWFLLFIVQYTVELGHSLFMNSTQENKIHSIQPCRR